MRVAALDIGTNTVLLLIVDVEGNVLRVVRDDHAIARLGEGVDKTHRISDAAYNRFIEILRTHQKTIAELHCHRIAAVATSAMRDAENREEIISRTKEDTGIEIALLSGEDEARWTYRGAVHGMIPRVEETTVIDIGGGSTEISFGRGEEFISGMSIDIGAVRLTERYFATGFTEQSVADARQYIKTVLREMAFRRPINSLIAVAGTPTTLAAMHLKLPHFDAHKVQGHVLTLENIEGLMNEMLSIGTEELLSRYPAVNKARADILPAGTLILAEAMDYLGAQSITVSTQGLRYGIALRAAKQ